jgi:carbon storage regulator
MLVLNRKINESIVIGNSIEIKVVRIGKNFVQIGIKAPKNFSIFREEIFNEIRRKNIEAIKSMAILDVQTIQSMLQSQAAEPSPPDKKTD